MATIPVNTSGVTDYIQSGYLHLAAAGSDGSDNSAPGNHLRWQLLGNLGNKHLPKGTLSNSGSYATSIAYNRNNDYVGLYRSVYYIDRYRTSVNLLTTAQDTIIDSGNTREWHYDGIVPVSGLTSNTNTIIVRFEDVSQYDYWAAIYHPTNAQSDFLQHYSGIIEAWVVDKLFLSAWITPDVIDSNDPGVVRSESISVPDTTDPASKILSGRKTVTDTSATQIELKGENMESIRFSYSNLYPALLSFQCYYDYLIGINREEKGAGNWTKVDDYSLSITDQETNDRLEDTSLYTIDQNWPRYYGSNPSNGDFTLSVPNYLDKWIPDTEPGVKDAVISYLDKSKTDVFALDSLASDTQNDQAQYDISYLETIKLIALDFHFARMFGLGCIDTPGSSLTYIYAATFKTLKDPSDETQTLSTFNVFMSLPVNQTTYRLPVAPYLEPVTYGMSVDNGTGSPTVLSDENGYALYDDIRFINLIKSSYPYDQAPGIFYESTTDFCMADVTRPVLFGTKYKLDTENDWRTPELNSDPDYLDSANINEVVPFPETQGPFFTHLETEEGIHEYAIYGVNLFSRVSDLSTIQSTDETDFPVRNTLLPPSNFQVQLIQQESPRILTTQFEQEYLLPGISGTDKTLVRTTFEWNEAHNIAYQTADKVDFYFCDHAPLTVRGLITSVSNAANNRSQVQLGSLTITSTNPAETIQPTISSGNASRFVGSQLAAGQQLYEVESIVTTGNTPVLLIKKIRLTQSQEYPIGSNQFITTESYVAPSTGDMIMLVENMANTANWSTHLIKQVNLVSFSPLHTETVTMSDGSQKVLNYGGLYRQGNLSHVLDPNTNQPTGIYSITFVNYSLPNHSDSDVDWYKGSVRLYSDSTPSVLKKLEVWNIETISNNLVLTVYDPANSAEPILDVNRTSRTGVDINFHPGYRVYLYKDDQSGNNFTASAILPATGDGSKITYMGIRSMDTSQSPDIYSPVSVPVPLLAREIVIPVAPAALNGPQYATRPDVYGKSTYTFDAELDTTGGRVPFGLMFFRASDRIVLGTLYSASTLEHVLEQLSNLIGDDATNYEMRILDVINGDIDTNTGTFKTYGTGTYRLPNPDNADLAIPDPNNSTISDPLINPFDGSYTLTDLAGDGILQAAIAHVFQPLTEQPVIYTYLKSGTKTSAKKPLFRDENGQLIPPVLPTDPNYDPDEYDPFPMAVAYTDSGNKFVRFTDYTIDGAATNVYFYYAIEFSNTNTYSGRSPVLGAVRLVNTLAPDAPQIRKVTTQLADSIQELDTAILFEVNSYLPSDGIGEFRIYRSINAQDALNIRTMSLAKTVDASDPLIDDFSDVTYPLYGEVLYYRIVAVRITKDENGNELKVPSQPSNTAMTNVVDILLPPAPALISENGNTTSNILSEVILKWKSTIYNGTYILLKQDAGIWREIYREKSNGSTIQYPPLDSNSQPDFVNYPETYSMNRLQVSGNKLFHSFMVQVINSSGLIGLEGPVLTLDKGEYDLLNGSEFLNYKDGNDFIQNPLVGGDVVYMGHSYPSSMLFTDNQRPLPAGHNTLTGIDITVEDDFGNGYTKTLPLNGSIGFQHGEGGLIFNSSNPNRIYTIYTLIKTDNYPSGTIRRSVLNYIDGPAYALLQMPYWCLLSDNIQEITPFISQKIDHGVAYPYLFSIICDMSMLPSGHTFSEFEVKISDSIGNSFIKTTNSSTGTLNFSDGEGGLILGSSGANLSYFIELTLKTDLIPSGVKKICQLFYTSKPGMDLEILQDVLSFEDGNSITQNPLPEVYDISSYGHPSGWLEFTDEISSSLPSGHTFERISIILSDNFGHYYIKDIETQGATVRFEDGDGDISLNLGTNNVYYVKALLYTDAFNIGQSFDYKITYDI